MKSGYRILRILLGVFGVFALSGVSLIWYFNTRADREVSHVAYQDHCGSCHGEHLQGTADGPSLMVEKLQQGDSTDDLIRSIAEHRQAIWSGQLSPLLVKALALYLGEHRRRFPAVTDSYEHRFKEQVVDSQHHRFGVELFSTLASRPYSIAPLRDGRIVVAEKVRGLSIVAEDGRQGPLIANAPRAHEQLISFQGSYLGWGQLLEVSLHPAYSENGWIYVSHADRCQLDCGSLVPQSMVRVVRGRILDGQWVDEQLIWSVHQDYYTIVPDGVAGGRLGFDRTGHLYISVGGKAVYRHLHDMNTPYGKIHRIRDDGSVPEDNPFWLPNDQRAPSSTRHTVWSYGHRTVQGLEGNPLTGEIWSSEMGPRGGDEINRITRGGNYGWPLYTHGLDYDSTEITIGKDLGLDFPIGDTELPVVDFTPAPAVSNITFHRGSQFSAWKNDLLVGSLKAMTLYRLRIENDVLIEQEKLVTKLGRIRDVEMGADGFVYIAIEQGDTGLIVRLVPHTS